MESIKNITEEDFNIYLKSIGGLESGYGGKYWGNSKFKNILFKITDWILWRLPYYEKSKEFCKESSIRIWLNNVLYKMFRWALKDHKPKNPFRSMIDDCGSFEISSGWYGLVKELIEKTIAAGWNKEVCQVKEKFGGLRFYINGASNEVYDIISKYEDLSYSICEECGEPGKERTGGWIRTLCEKCYQYK